MCRKDEKLQSETNDTHHDLDLHPLYQPYTHHQRIQLRNVIQIPRLNCPMSYTCHPTLITTTKRARPCPRVDDYLLRRERMIIIIRRLAQVATTLNMTIAYQIDEQSQRVNLPPSPMRLIVMMLTPQQNHSILSQYILTHSLMWITTMSTTPPSCHVHRVRLSLMVVSES